MLRVLTTLCALLLPASPVRATETWTYFLTGDAADATPVRTEGGLLLAGGGGFADAAMRWFIAQAGGGDLVVLRASGADGYHDYLHRELGGVDSVETLLFHARAAASDPRVLAIVARAEGIILAGGDQARYVELWGGTPLAAALDAHVRAGRPLAGTSAGLAVMGEFIFSAREPGSLTSPLALRDPFDPQVTLETDFLHLALLRGVITDSHFAERARLGRSLVFLARLRAEHARPDLVGLGVDERTALAVAADGTARVHSATPEGSVWLLQAAAPADNLAPGQPLTWRDVHVTRLSDCATLDLPARRITSPAPVFSVSVDDGQLSPLP